MAPSSPSLAKASKALIDNYTEERASLLSREKRRNARTVVESFLQVKALENYIAQEETTSLWKYYSTNLEEKVSKYLEALVLSDPHHTLPWLPYVQEEKARAASGVFFQGWRQEWHGLIDFLRDTPHPLVDRLAKWQAFNETLPPPWPAWEAYFKTVATLQEAIKKLVALEVTEIVEAAGITGGLSLEEARAALASLAMLPPGGWEVKHVFLKLLEDWQETEEALEGHCSQRWLKPSALPLALVDFPQVL